MDMIRIRSCFSQDVTVVSNEFLDRFLPEANGDFIKIYLYLLRIAGSSPDGFSVSSVADRMNCTEKDVERALRYFEKEGVLSIHFDEGGNATDIAFTSLCTRPERTGEAAAAKSSDITTERMAELGSRDDIRELIFIAQQYLGKPLTRSEMQKICFFYDSLRFSPDLIDYLIEYCVSRNHKSFNYIEKVAIGWKEQGICTVRDARVAAGSYHREYYDILKALGIDNHHPIDAEIRIMKKWIEKYSFSMEIIREACTRTVMGASRPTLQYADSILSKWHANGVRTKEDIEKLDKEHALSVTEKKTAQAKPKVKKNSFTDFEQRQYDFDSLESALIGGK
ncbi:MAG: DnaD domain protein [Lachnospiraceae bacterium]|nr:DnaD domain protein [Lachnospiraceae bacterium]